MQPQVDTSPSASRLFSTELHEPSHERPRPDRLLSDARRNRFNVVLVAAFDRVARSVRHFLDVLDELNQIGIEFVSLHESIDSGDPLGRAIVAILRANGELERNLSVERVKAGMRRAKLEGRRIGRAPRRGKKGGLVGWHGSEIS